MSMYNCDKCARAIDTDCDAVWHHNDLQLCELCYEEEVKEDE